MKKHESQRGYFAYHLHKLMKDDNIYLLFGDLGYGMLDQLRADYSFRCINTGAAEQVMLDMAIGLALEGKIPVCYSITPFLLFRPFESLRTYIDHENIKVKLIGGGRDYDYKDDGMSHLAHDDQLFMQHFENIKCLYPSKKEDITYNYVKEVIYNDKATYLNLKR